MNARDRQEEDAVVPLSDYDLVAGWCAELTTASLGRDVWSVEGRVKVPGRCCSCPVCNPGAALFAALIHRRRFGHRLAEHVQFLAPIWFYRTPDGRPAFDNYVRRMTDEMDRFEAGLGRSGLPPQPPGGTHDGGRRSAA